MPGGAAKKLKPTFVDQTQATTGAAEAAHDANVTAVFGAHQLVAVIGDALDIESAEAFVGAKDSVKALYQKRLDWRKIDKEHYETVTLACEGPKLVYNKMPYTILKSCEFDTKYRAAKAQCLRETSQARQLKCKRIIMEKDSGPWLHYLMDGWADTDNNMKRVLQEATVLRLDVSLHMEWLKNGGKEYLGYKDPTLVYFNRLFPNVTRLEWKCVGDPAVVLDVENQLHSLERNWVCADGDGIDTMKWQNITSITYPSSYVASCMEDMELRCFFEPTSVDVHC
jgi:hypothetical protein